MTGAVSTTGMRWELIDTYLSAWIPVMVWILLVLGNLLWVLLANLPLTHLLADARVELTHLTALSHGVPSFTKILRSLDGTFASAGPDAERF